MSNLAPCQIRVNFEPFLQRINPHWPSGEYPLVQACSYYVNYLTELHFIFSNAIRKWCKFSPRGKTSVTSIETGLPPTRMNRWSILGLSPRSIGCIITPYCHWSLACRIIRFINVLKYSWSIICLWPDEREERRRAGKWMTTCVRRVRRVKYEITLMRA